MRSKALYLLLFALFPLSIAPQAQDLAAQIKRSSSAITVTLDGAYLLVVNPDSHSLTIVDTATQAVVIELAVGTDPRSVAVSPDSNNAYVVNQGSDTLSVIDMAVLRVSTEIPVGDRPVGVAVSPDGRFVAVTELGDDRVRILRSAGLETLAVYPVADRPYSLAFTHDGRELLVSHLLSGSVTVLDVRPFTLYMPLINRVWNAVDAWLPIVRTSYSLPDSVHSATSIPTWPNVAPAPGIIVNAAGTRVYLPQTMANGQGLNAQFDTTVFPKVSVLDLQARAHLSSEHISLPETDQPVGLPWDAALAKGDTELWVVNAASDDISVVDISNALTPGRVANIPVGHNPRGIGLSPDGHTAYVNNTLSGTVSVIDTGAYTVTAVITVTDIPLPPVLLNGKRLFHSSTRPDLARARWVSCNTCHVEGEHDGRTWLLPFTGNVTPGATPVITRNTTSLLGMVETYPLRWSAEWDESADSEFSIRFEQFGTGLIDGDMHPTLGEPNQGRSTDLDSLAAFIDSLAVPIRMHKQSPAEKRGQNLFFSAETDCATCHPPPLYTDLQVHDVGTADGDSEWFGPLIDTPSLRFLYDSGPYLHDGSADTLLKVLRDSNPDNKHGITSHLTDQEILDLVTFLLALP